MNVQPTTADGFPSGYKIIYRAVDLTFQQAVEICKTFKAPGPRYFPEVYATEWLRDKKPFITVWQPPANFTGWCLSPENDIGQSRVEKRRDGKLMDSWTGLDVSEAWWDGTCD